MKVIRDRIHKWFEVVLYRMFLNSYWNDVLPKDKLDKFIGWGVSFTYFLLNVGIFFAVYFIFNKVYSNVGFEKTIIVGFVVIIAMLRVFLENKD